jgi:hypothetical protein
MNEKQDKTCGITSDITNETLRFTANLARVLFDCLGNAGDLELAPMAHEILEKLEAEVTLRGGVHMLISEKAVYPHFCPRFKTDETKSGREPPI